MNIAVTAASGKLGKEIIQTLLAQESNNNVIGLARTPNNAKDLGVEIRPGDYNDRNTLEKSLKSIDRLLLISGMDEPSKRIEQHRSVLEAAKICGVKKIVYTSIQGAEEGTAFSHIVQSNRQTEKDIINSGLAWAIGRNGIYIEPDIEYIETYKKKGGVINCAGDGKCGYTTRPELAYAYSKLLAQDEHNANIFNLHGESLTQYQLTNYLNDTFSTNLTYTSISVEEYRKERVAELGEFIGTIIAGIYQGIHEGAVDNPSDFNKATGREHASWHSYFTKIKSSL
jgi:NAD(P)H dehydrogenase (quinone)